MKFLKAILFVWALSVAASAQLDTSGQDFYMYIYFIDEQAGAYIALSTDGINFVKCNNNKTVIQPKIAVGETPLMRDPNTYFDPNTGIFHLVWTTAWNQDNIGYATSSDLINWSEQIMIPVGRQIKGCQVCWAPELFYDDLKDSVMVMWSTARGNGGKEAFCCFTKDFRHFSSPWVYFEPHDVLGNRYTVIDETLVKLADSVYYMFFKDERKPSEAGKQSQNIHYVMGKTPQGNNGKGNWTLGEWDEVSFPITAPAYEGPTAIVIGDELRVYADPFKDFSSTKRMVKASVSELGAGGFFTFQESKFTEGPAMKTLDGDDFLISHGSISKIPKAKALQLLYGIPDQTVYPQSWTSPADSEIVVAPPLPEAEKVYPYGKQNCGCGSGVGLAFFPPIVFKAMASRRRKKRKKAKKA